MGIVYIFLILFTAVERNGAISANGRGKQHINDIFTNFILKTIII